MKYTIALIPGDGIGEELVQQAVSVLEKIGTVYGHTFVFKTVEAGTAAFEKGLPPMPAESLEICKEADALILGKISVGKHPGIPFEQRPESIIAVLRSQLDLCSDIRPAFLWEPLKATCPLKDTIRQKGMDVIVVRDIAGGMFMNDGCRCDLPDTRAALDTELYNERQIRDSARIAFQTARTRRSKVTSLDKAILLQSSCLWRQVVTEVAKEYPDVTLTHKLVDSAAQDIIEHPDEYDVILTSNVFGDIIADEIAGLVGASEILPSAVVSTNRKGMYQPNQLHATHSEIEGQNKANPIGIILATAMLLEYSLDLKKEAAAVRQAVARTLYDNAATEDVWALGKQKIGTKQMTDAIKRKIT